MFFQTGVGPPEIELHIEMGAGGRWRVGVVGHSSVWDVVAPLADVDLQGLPGLDPSIRTWASLLARLDARDPPCPGALWLGVGAALRARLLTPHVEAALHREGLLGASPGAPVRVLLRVAPDEELLPWAKLPLELLFDGRQLLFKRPGIRVLRAGSTLRTDMDPARRLRWTSSVGWLIAATGGEATVTQVEAMEREARRSGLGSQVLIGATREALSSALRLSGWDLLCLFALTAEEADTHGRIWLADGPITGAELGAMLEGGGRDNQGLQLAFVAGIDRGPQLAPSGSMDIVRHLVHSARRAAFGVGFRSSVDPAAACALAGHMVTRICGAIPPDQAFAEATVDVQRPPSEWAAPVLFSRRRDPFATLRATTVRAQPDIHFGGRPSPPGLPAPPRSPSLLPRCPRRPFVGRDQALALVSTWLASPREPPIGVLSGAGGVGKTELAIQLAYQVTLHQCVLWLHRPDRDVEEALRRVRMQTDFAQDNGPAGQSWWTPSPGPFAMYGQSRSSEKGLVILDDVEDGRCAGDLHERSGWKVLITSRRGDVAPGAAQLELGPLDAWSSIQLLWRTAWGTEAPPQAGTSPAAAFAQDAGGVPLWLEIAGAAWRSGLSIEAWRQSRRRLPAGEDTRALWAVAAFPDASVRPRDVARALGEPEGRVARRLQRLARARLLDEAEDTGEVTLHDVVRQAARDEALAQDPVAWASLQEAASAPGEQG